MTTRMASSSLQAMDDPCWRVLRIGGLSYRLLDLRYESLRWGWLSDLILWEYNNQTVKDQYKTTTPQIR